MRRGFWAGLIGVGIIVAGSPLRAAENAERALIEFTDTVRSVDARDDGSFRVTFRVHAAIYQLKEKALLPSIQESRAGKTPIRVGADPDTLEIIKSDPAKP